MIQREKFKSVFVKVLSPYTLFKRPICDRSKLLVVIGTRLVAGRDELSIFTGANEPLSVEEGTYTGR